MANKHVIVSPRGEDPLNKVKRLDTNFRVALVNAGAKVQFFTVATMDALAPNTIATGTTRRSISVSRVQRGFVGGKFTSFVTVGPRTAYSLWGVGIGRGPGARPPLRNIYRWVREKPGGAGMPDAMRWAVARKVQQKIALRGTTAYNVLDIGLRRALPSIRQAMRVAVRTTFQ